MQGRVALSPRAGGRVRLLGDEPDIGHVASRGPRQAELAGFDFHAKVSVPPNDRARLEQLCRSLLHPALAQHRVQLRADGRVFVALKSAWRDGTSHLLFDPIELLEKLAAITPRRTVNLVLYQPLHHRVPLDVVQEAVSPLPLPDLRRREGLLEQLPVHRSTRSFTQSGTSSPVTAAGAGAEPALRVEPVRRDNH